MVWLLINDQTLAETMATFSKLKFVDEKSPKLVFGYIRAIERTVTSKEHEIPDDIKNLCLLYFYIIFEQFDVASHRLKLSSSDKDKENDIVEQIHAASWNNVFGKRIIDPEQNPNCIYIWTLQFKCNPDQENSSTPSIGIISKDNKCYTDMTEYCFMYDNHNFYCWETAWSASRMRGKETSSYAQTFIRSGDIIKMEFNVKNKSLRFYCNDKDLGVSQDNIDINCQYCLALSFATQTHSMQILNFEIK